MAGPRLDPLDPPRASAPWPSIPPWTAPPTQSSTDSVSPSGSPLVTSRPRRRSQPRGPAQRRSTDASTRSSGCSTSPPTRGRTATGRAGSPVSRSCSRTSTSTSPGIRRRRAAARWHRCPRRRPPPSCSAGSPQGWSSSAGRTPRSSGRRGSPSPSCSAPAATRGTSSAHPAGRRVGRRPRWPRASFRWPRRVTAVAPSAYPPRAVACSDSSPAEGCSRRAPRSASRCSGPQWTASSPAPYVTPQRCSTS